MVFNSSMNFTGAYLMVGFFALMGFSKAASHWEEQQLLAEYMAWELKIALDLDALQLRQVKEINREFYEQVFVVYENRQENKFPAGEVNKLIWKRHAQLLEILTDQQQRTWQGMVLRNKSKKE